jgi:hypothetical protein
MSDSMEASKPAVHRSEWRLLALVLTVGFAAFALALLMRMNAGPSGDEPAYLVISQTFQKYHSFDVTKDYNHQDYRVFYNHHLDPHVVPAPNGRMEPLHNFGGPLLWLIPFIIWGRIGAAGFVGVVSLLIVANVYYFLRERGIAVRYALLTTALLALASPVYTYAAMNFVEPIGALLILYAVRVLLGPGLNRVRLLVAGIGLAYLPWVHPRYLVFALIIAFLLLIRLYREIAAARLRAMLPVLVPLAVSLVLIAVYNKVEWGTVSPVSNMTGANAGPFEISPLIGGSGILLDRQFGLLTNYPIFLLLLPGFLLSLDRSRLWLNAVFGCVFVPYLTLITTFNQWHAGFTPPARYIMLLVPLMSFYVAYALQRLNSVVADCAAVLVGAATFALSVSTDIVPALRFSRPGQMNPGMKLLGNVVKIHFVQHLPSAVFPKSWVHMMLWFAAATLLGVLIFLYGLSRPRLAAETWPPRPPRRASGEAGPADGDGPAPGNAREDGEQATNGGAAASIGIGATVLGHEPEMRSHSA